MTDSTAIMLKKFAISSSAAAMAESATFPLDLTKTRMQTANMNAQGQQVKPSMWRTAYAIVRQEKLSGLWQGLSPAVMRHVIYSGFRLSIYEQLRKRIFTPDQDGHLATWKTATCGLAAGALGQLIASPTDLVKVRMQTQGRDVLNGHARRYKNLPHAFVSIVRQEGWAGLYKGCIPNVQRAALVGLGDIATYDASKQLLRQRFQLEDGFAMHAAASGCSGVAAALLGTPADVVKTRIMNQPVVNGKGVLYSSSVDCLVKTVRAEGVLSLWRGVVPIWLRMAPWSLTFWTVYEQIRRVAGMDGF